MKKLLTAIAVLAGIMSCAEVNEKLASDLVATDQKYDIFTAEVNIDDIQMASVDSISGYSSRRIAFGAIRDDSFGLFRKGCAVTLVPVLDSVYFGEKPVFKSFKFRAGVDSTSVADLSQVNILQNVNVYALTEPLDTSKYFASTEVKHGNKRITKGIPVANGKDSLVFNFTEEFGKQYLNITQDDLSDMKKYTQKFPGIYFTTDDPVGNGGRFNMYNMEILDNHSSTTIQRTDNYAVLYYSGEYDGERRDSLLMFYFSPLDFEDLDSLYYNSQTSTQYVFNVDYHEKTALMTGPADEEIYIEGGSGLKPMVPAAEIRRIVSEDVIKNGGKPEDAVITKATVVLPFTFPDDYKTMYRFPVNLSPTIKTHSDGTVYYAGLTDASVSTENQGDIDRSHCCYSPDITHHVQQILRQTDESKISLYDVWFLVMWYETTVTYNSEADEMAQYYQQLAYYSYYNSLYGGYGYGSMSSGSYGGYSSYSNYYSYMMMAQSYSSAANSSSTSTELDKDRYYHATLHGPAYKGSKPTLKFSYALPKKQ